jgi:hypothetical protein
MKVNYYLTIKKSDVVIETKYFWYYPEGYTCVDARYINIVASNSSALFDLESFFYKLIYLNDNISEGVLIDEGLKMLNKYKRTSGVFISEEDIFNVARKCYSQEFNSYLLERIYTVKKVMWKSCVTELYQMSDDEKKEYDSLSGYKKDLYLMNFKGKKKQKEVIVFLNKLKGMDKKKKVIEAVEILNLKNKYKDGVFIHDIMKETGFSFKTVKKYFEDYVNNDINVNGYKTIPNKNEISKQEKISEIQSVINQMKINREKINKKSVADKSGSSRTTVIKHWDNLNK